MNLFPPGRVIDRVSRSQSRQEPLPHEVSTGSSPLESADVDVTFTYSLIADICNMPVQLPYSHSASVVLGSAMLGCAAAEEASRLQSSRLDNQEAAEKSSFGMKDRLWDVMASVFRCVAEPRIRHRLITIPFAQIRMSRPGTTVKPSASEQELKLLQVKYDIFRECIEIQRRWRAKVRDALGE